MGRHVCGSLLNRLKCILILEYVMNLNRVKHSSCHKSIAFLTISTLFNRTEMNDVFAIMLMGVGLICECD